MKVTDVTALAGALKAKPVDGTTTTTTTAPDIDVHVPKDRVSVKSTKEAEAAVATAQRAAGTQRNARTERLEADVRAGSYRPDPARVAQQILADAEIDARLSEMLRH
jgi:anti-sigma28 factor (negative regulator of flagellin synthesis)